MSRVTCHGMSGSYIIAPGLSFVRVIRTHLSEMKPTAIFWILGCSAFNLSYFIILSLFTLVVSCAGLLCLDKWSYLSLDDLDVT